MTPLDTQKVAKLTAQHGHLFLNPLKSGRIPVKEILNLYGRAIPRQSAILMAMQSGVSYSAAYKKSAGVFDTKRWNKVDVLLPR
ncbi:MAG: hypothetical protein KDA84_29535 [Planctomycetaceae bacterium]|nr:hypothetical protein [Planctomycetaceae bacterium]